MVHLILELLLNEFIELISPTVLDVVPAPAGSFFHSPCISFCLQSASACDVHLLLTLLTSGPTGSPGPAFTSCLCLHGAHARMSHQPQCVLSLQPCISHFGASINLLPTGQIPLFMPPILCGFDPDTEGLPAGLPGADFLFP